MIGPTVAGTEWHRVMAARSWAARPRLRVGHLLAANLPAAGAFAYLHHLSLASRGSAIPVGLAVAASVMVLAAFVSACVAGAIHLGRASSALRRRGEGGTRLGGGAIRMASAFARFGAFALLGLVGLLFSIGVGSVAMIVIGNISAA